MAVHDWTRVDACIFHSFHLSWTVAISGLFNSGGLPPGYYSLTEQHRPVFGFDLPPIGRRSDVDEVSGKGPHARRIERMSREPRPDPPEAHLVVESDVEHYRRRHRTVTIRDDCDHEVVAVVEIVSPADKHSPRAVRLFIEKTAQFLERDIHVLIVDVCPPGKFDLHGMHGAVWQEVVGHDYVPAPDKPLTLASYESQGAIRAYVEPVAVGDRLPEMPLFLRSGRHVKVPLETTYQAAWTSMPAVLKEMIEAKP